MLYHSELVEMVVYRGHINTPYINSSPEYLYYSSTLYERIAREEFTNDKCCVFKINLINVPVINVNKFLQGTISSYQEENKYIFLGGGTFYKNENMIEPVFFKHSNRLYEGWYTITTNYKDTKIINQDTTQHRGMIDMIMSRIDEE